MTLHSVAHLATDFHLLSSFPSCLRGVPFRFPLCPFYSRILESSLSSYFCSPSFLRSCPTRSLLFASRSPLSFTSLLVLIQGTWFSCPISSFQFLSAPSFTLASLLVFSPRYFPLRILLLCVSQSTSLVPSSPLSVSCCAERRRRLSLCAAHTHLHCTPLSRAVSMLSLQLYPLVSLCLCSSLGLSPPHHKHPNTRTVRSKHPFVASLERSKIL